jgi:cyclophilin family peptidyl-prolyl cis-trans isomerase
VIPPRALVAALAALAVAASAGCGDDGGAGGEQASGLPEGCSEVSAPAPRQGDGAQPPGKRLQGKASAVVTTSCGAFTIGLDTSGSPKTSSSFASLAEQGFYDDTPIHRIARDFVIQGGDPNGDGTGGPGYSVDEPPPDDLTFTAGTVAMAKTAAEPPGRSGSQFFIVTAPADAGLPPDYALLGRVSEGFEVVERIELLGDPTGADGPPTAPVVIESITIEAG